MCAAAAGWRHPLGGWVLVCLLLSGLVACERSGSAPEALAGIVFVDQDGRTVRPDVFAEEVLVLNFMFTSCPSVCPRLTGFLVEARGRLPDHLRERVRFLSVSVDPENDTSGALKAFAQRWGGDVPNWRFSRVNEDALARLAQRLVIFEPGQPPSPSAHNGDVYLFDRTGRLVQRYSGSATKAERLARDIIALDALGRASADRNDLGEPASRVVRIERGLEQ